MKSMCNVCGNSSFEEQRIDEVYENANGEKIVLTNIPATVCLICGERTFSLQTTRHIVELLNTKPHIVKTMPVVEYT